MGSHPTASQLAPEGVAATPAANSPAASFSRRTFVPSMFQQFKPMISGYGD
jgi:hypothetical protein